MKTTAILACISMEQGVVLWKDYGKSVDIPKFIDFLERLSLKMGQKPFYLFMDNLAVHRSKVAHAAMDRLKIFPLFNAPYSPQFNPIEFTFQSVKARFK